MKPIRFSLAETLPLSPDEIAGQIMDLGNWPKFEGYGLVPGIKTAEFESRTEAVIGTRIRVTNRDGSTHVEEIVEWIPQSRLRLDMKCFSPPLSRLASGIEETWEFERIAEGTHVVRAFNVFPKSFVARPILWLISLMLKRAIARHLEMMRRDAEARKGK